MECCEIRRIASYEECRGFVDSFSNDPAFSDPMLSNEAQVAANLRKPIEECPEQYAVLGVYEDELLIGLFSFAVLEEERYLELLVGLSRSSAAYSAILRYLERSYPGCDVDFVFNPQNVLLRELLEQMGAAFEPEQQKMVLDELVSGVDTSGVVLLTPQYAPQYFAMHNRDMYWTGEKVAAATDRFRTLLAIEDDIVVGYLDVTHCFDENEPYDLLVREEYRRKGYGRKLLARAVELNRPRGMMLLVDVDNVDAIRLYESLGFEKVEHQNSLTARWRVPSAAEW